MSAKIQRTIKNIPRIHGVDNPEFNPDPETPLIRLVVLSENSDPPKWSGKVEEEYVEFPTHGEAEQRAHEINQKYPWIYCYARCIPRAEPELPPVETLPLQSPLIPIRELAQPEPPPPPPPEAPKTTADSEIMRARLSDATPEHRLRTLRRLAKKKAAPAAKEPAETTGKNWWRDEQREIRLPYRDD